jgi:membrane protein YqaA with SNARE-associated domain
LTPSNDNPREIPAATSPPYFAPRDPRGAPQDLPTRDSRGAPPDEVRVVRWFAFYALCLLAAAIPLVVLASHEPWSWAQWRAHPAAVLAATSPAVKLLAFGIYVSLCCTFVPLPVNWIVAAVALQQCAVAPNAWATTAAVATVGAVGSTLANLNDYHLFTWLLRSRHVAKVRHTRLYQASARWFARSPLFILVIFSIIPIPVDVIRMLATVFRYGRVPFAAANFVGRFVRYAVIAYVTYALGNKGWWAVLGLLGLAVVLAAIKVLPAGVRRMVARRASSAA